MKKKLFLVLCLLWIVNLLLAEVITPVKKLSHKGYNVLLIHSYNSTYVWSENITSGIKDYFSDNSSSRVNLYLEYLDAKRYPGNDFMEKMYMVIEDKYKGSEFDLVIASDNQALVFLMRYGELIFPDIPVVFCGINFLEQFDLSGFPNYTGIAEMIRPDLTLEQILTLQPEVKKLFIVSDCSTKTGVAAVRQTRNLLKEYESRIDILYPVNSTMQKLQEDLASLTEEYAVLLLIYNIDKEGNFFDVVEAAEMISNASTVPVYGCWNFYLGNGIIGGAMLKGYDQGQYAAEYALKIINGSKPSELEIIWKSPIHNIYDWDLLEKYDLKTSRLPASVELINHEPGYLRQNWRWLLFFLLVIAAMLFYIITLLNTQKHLQKSRLNLKQKEEEWRSLANSLPGVVFRINPDKKFIYINSYIEKLLHQKPQNIIGKEIKDLKLGKEIKRINEEALDKVLETGQAQKADFNYSDSNIQYAFETNIQPEFDPKGNIISMLGIVYDLSERYKTELQLIESEKRGNEARKIAKLGYWQLDIEKNRLFWSPEISEILGIEHAPEKQSLEYLSHIFGIPVNTIKRVLRSSVRSGNLQFNNIQNINLKNSQTKWIHERGEIFVDGNNEPVSVYGTVQDITSEKEAEIKIQANEAKFRAIFDNAPMAIFLMNPNNEIVYFNKALHNITAYSDEELGTMRLKDLVHPKDLDRCLQKYHELFNGKISNFAFRKRIMRKDGTILWCLTTVAILHSKEDNNTYALTMDIDINERVTAEKMVAESRQLLQEAQKIARFGYWKFDEDNNIVVCSAEMMHILGYERGARNRFRIDDFTALFAENDRTAFKKLVSDVNNTSSAVEMTAEIVNRKKKIMQISIRMAAQKSDSEKITIVGTFIDITRIKRIESQLRQSEERFRLFFENSPLSIIILDNDDRVNLINPATEQLFGLSRHRMQNMKITTLLHEGEYQKFLTDLKSIKKGEKSLTEEYLLKRTSHNLFWSSITMAALHREESLQQGIILLIEDINEQKIAREKLRESEEKFRSVFEVSQDGLFLTHMEKNEILETNSAGAQMFGYHKKELIGRNILDLMAEHSKMSKLFSEKTPLIFGEWGVKQNGKSFPMEISSNYFVKDNKNYHVASIRNISERFKFEEELKKSEKKFRTIVENAPLGVVFYDREGRNLFNNNLIKKMFKTKEDIDLNSLESFMNLEKQADYRFILEEIFQGNRIQYFDEQQLFRSDGTEFFARILISVVRTETNKPDFAILMLQDITQQREAEQKVHLYEKLQSIGQLAGMIAHDFNNQLMGILGYSSILEESLANSSLKQYASMIYNSAERSALLTRKLLSFARKGKNIVMNLNFHKIINETISLIQTTSIANIKIHQLLKARQMIVSGDPGQIQNALLNLILNACDAMPEGGEITISTNNMELKKEDSHNFFDEVAPGLYLQIIIADTGHGMSEKVKEHLFEPFFTTKREGKGTGLGLPAVFGTVKSHQGYLSFSSEENKGSAFYLYFPLAEVQIEDKQPKHPTPKSFQGNATIMVVDDEEIVRNTVKHLLTSIGYQVILHSNGPQAIAYYRSNKDDIDLVLLDVIMPKMEGPEVYSELRKINPEVKVLIFSAYTTTSEVQKALDNGVIGFIRKPVLREELSQKIALALADEESFSSNEMLSSSGNNVSVNSKLVSQMKTNMVSHFELIQTKLELALQEKNLDLYDMLLNSLELFINKTRNKQAIYIFRSIKKKQNISFTDFKELMHKIKVVIFSLNEDK